MARIFKELLADFPEVSLTLSDGNPERNRPDAVASCEFLRSCTDLDHNLSFRCWQKDGDRGWVWYEEARAGYRRSGGATGADVDILEKTTRSLTPYARGDPETSGTYTSYISLPGSGGIPTVFEISGFAHPPEDQDLLHIQYLCFAFFLRDFIRTLNLKNQELNHSLTQTQRHLVETQENERKLIAMEVHDVISQRAAAIFYRLQTCQYYAQQGHRDRVDRELDDLCAMARILVDDVTRLMFNLNPPHLEEMGLEVSLRRYMDQYEQEHGVRVQMDWQGPSRRFHEDIELSVYRIIQESLTNVRKHAGCTTAQVSICIDANELQCVISDDGVGFDPASMSDAGGKDGFGIPSMKERAATCNGRLEVNSSPGKGTTVSLVIPTRKSS